MTRPTSRRTLAGPRPAALLAAAALALGCGGAEPAPPAPGLPAYPPDAVLGVDGVPITAAEVERWLPLVARLEPDKVPAHWRRLALSNIVLPTRAAEALDAPARDAAYAEATRLRGLAVELDRLPDDATVRDVAEGTWNEIGLVDWEVARTLPPGAWSEVYETVGGWAFFRLLERPADPAEWGPMTPVKVERAHVFFLDPEGVQPLVEAALRTLPIDVLDPEWEALVPPVYLQHARRP